MVVICGGGDCRDFLNSIIRKFSNQTCLDKIKVLMTCSDRVAPTIGPRVFDSGHRYGEYQVEVCVSRQNGLNAVS